MTSKSVFHKIAFSGPAGAGKDAISDLIQNRHKLDRLAFATPLKNLICSNLGMDHQEFDHLKNGGAGPEEAERHRKLIQDVGEAFRRFDELHWIKQMTQEVVFLEEEGYSHGVVVTDARYQNEAMQLRKHGFFMVYVDCPDHFKRLSPTTAKHGSENDLTGWLRSTLKGENTQERFDLYIYNDRVHGVDAYADVVWTMYQQALGAAMKVK